MGGVWSSHSHAVDPGTRMRHVRSGDDEWVWLTVAEVVRDPVGTSSSREPLQRGGRGP